MEKIVLSPEELQKLKSLKDTQANLFYNLGEIEVQLEELNKLKKDILSRINNFKEESNQIAISIQDKYGEGIADLDTGEFIKS
jgi:hypothetical protein